MRLLIDRRWKKSTYTIGILYIDGVRFCETLEDADRGLQQKESVYSILSKKIYGETAIPTGSYTIRMDVVSPKYEAVSWYRQLTGGRMPRLSYVPGFEGVLIHPGNTPLDTLGCILVGRNTIKGQVTSSRDTFKALYKKMKAASERGEQIILEIK